MTPPTIKLVHCYTITVSLLLLWVVMKISVFPMVLGDPPKGLWPTGWELLVYSHCGKIVLNSEIIAAECILLAGLYGIIWAGKAYSWVLNIGEEGQLLIGYWGEVWQGEPWDQQTAFPGRHCGCRQMLTPEKECWNVLPFPKPSCSVSGFSTPSQEVVLPPQSFVCQNFSWWEATHISAHPR